MLVKAKHIRKTFGKKWQNHNWYIGQGHQEVHLKQIYAIGFEINWRLKTDQLEMMDDY